ncbi:MAG: serine/threonine protein kinase [Planctomycetaceae bacterium]|jgi:serine/threonine protein kinase|nr:serine/threonine protein kinase [Planctomycetaceae bacterium]
MMSFAVDYIGPYRLLEVVNRGQSCCLWRAYDDAKREFVGLKTLLESKVQDKDQMLLLEHEFKVAEKFDHPNLIRIYHYDKSGKNPYICMEWFPAINMKTWINRGYDTYCRHLPQIMLQMAAALQYQHDNGWIHRDVKPDNFLFDPETVRIKMIDFALARRIVTGFMKYFTAKSKVQGTASYMSPEQIQGQPPEPGADIYSLGCTFYELLTARLVFAGETLADLLHKHIGTPPPTIALRNKNVTPGFSDLLKAMLAKKPADRPKSMKEVIHFLQSVPIFRRTPEKKDIC